MIMPNVLEMTLIDYFAINCRRDFDVQFAGLFSNEWARTYVL